MFFIVFKLLELTMGCSHHLGMSMHLPVDACLFPITECIHVDCVAFTMEQKGITYLQGHPLVQVFHHYHLHKRVHEDQKIRRLPFNVE